MPVGPELPPPGGAPLTPRDVAGAVERAVYSSPSFGQLDDGTRADIAGSLAAVTRYLRADPHAAALGDPLSRQLAPDLSSLRRTDAPPPANGSAPASGPASAPPASGSAGGGASVRRSEERSGASCRDSGSPSAAAWGSARR